MDSEVLWHFGMIPRDELDGHINYRSVQRSYMIPCWAQIPTTDLLARALPEVLSGLHANPGQCTDIKDREYSVLMLAYSESYEQYPLTVDYNKTPTDLFIELIRRRYSQIDQDPDFKLPSKLQELRFHIWIAQGLLEVKGQPEALRLWQASKEICLLGRA